MLRRSFLGSIIGLIGSSQFYANEVVEREANRLQRLEAYCDLFRNYRASNGIKMFAIVGNERIYAPELVRVSVNKEDLIATFESSQLISNCKFTICRIGVIYKPYNLIISSRETFIYVQADDKVTFSYTLNIKTIGDS